MRKKEIRIFAAIFSLALLFWIAMALFGRLHNTSFVRITVGGTEFGTYSLAEDQTIPIGDGNVCEIRDGKARMISSDCPDQLCVKQPPVDQNGGSIICLPHQVVIRGSTSSSQPPQIDAVSSCPQDFFHT